MSAEDNKPPGVIAALQAFGWVFVALAVIAIIAAMIAYASTVEGAGTLAWVEVAGAVVVGVILLGLAAIIDKLHRIEVLLTRPRAEQ